MLASQQVILCVTGTPLLERRQQLSIPSLEVPSDKSTEDQNPWWTKVFIGLTGHGWGATYIMQVTPPQKKTQLHHQKDSFIDDNFPIAV